MTKSFKFGVLTLILTSIAGNAIAAETKPASGIISMDGGMEIFMDKRAPEDRIVSMDGGMEIFMDKKSPEDRIISMDGGNEI